MSPLAVIGPSLVVLFVYSWRTDRQDRARRLRAVQRRQARQRTTRKATGKRRTRR